jgi:hypothetical protein
MTPLRFKRNISVGLCAALVSWLRCPTNLGRWMADVDNLLWRCKPTREPLTLIRIFDGPAKARLRGRDNTPQ